MINYQKSTYSVKCFTSKAELSESLYGKDNRPSYTKQQLIKMGFKEEYILGRYFEQSSENILDTNITLKMKRNLKVNGEELKTIYELLDALNNGYEVTYPTSKPELKTEFYRVTENVPTQVDRTVDTYQVNGLTKAELSEIIYGKDNRPSYTKQQLIEMGFKEEYILGRYFEQSSENILDTNITLKMKRNLKVNGEELKTIYELLNALNNGYEITFPTSKPELKTEFYRVTENVPTQVDRTVDTYQVNGLTKAELSEIIYGKDNRPSYTKQQLIKMGFKEEYILGRYFEQSSENILDTNITLKMKRNLKVDNKELKTIYELLDALNNGYEVTFPTSKPEFKTKFYRKS